MSHNSFVHMFRVTTWGESHGPAIGCVIDGCPPGIVFSHEDIQSYLNRRRPAQSIFTTQRNEPDHVLILSGVLQEQDSYITTGTPISMMIENRDQRSKDYAALKNVYRPGHADYTYAMKYGLRDHRGGGRASGRETAMRVAAGAIARKVVPGISIRGAIVAIGPHKINEAHWDWNQVDKNPFFTPDEAAVPRFSSYLEEIKKQGSSVGALIKIIAENVPPGLGAPLYGKLDQDIAALLMSINAVKAVEIGAGFRSAQMLGPENTDAMASDGEGKVLFLSNEAGGILGGISTGQPIVVSFAVKPTSSIVQPQHSVNVDGQDVVVQSKGRHDPCIGIRCVAVGEAMVACALADHYLRHRAQIGQA